MKKSIQATIKDAAKAFRAGVSEEMFRWALISDGWKADQADSICRWGKVFVSNTQGQDTLYPDTTVITVDTNNNT